MQIPRDNMDDIGVGLGVYEGFARPTLFRVTCLVSRCYIRWFNGYFVPHRVAEVYIEYRYRGT